MLKYITGPDCYLTGWWFTDWVYLVWFTWISYFNYTVVPSRRLFDTGINYLTPNSDKRLPLPTITMFTGIVDPMQTASGGYRLIFTRGWGDNIRTLLSAEINTLRPKQHGRLFPDDISKDIFLNQNIWISIRISLKFVPRGPFNNIPALVQIMAWRRPGYKPLSETMMVSLLTHICVTRP